MKINDNEVTTRHERPTVLGPTALILYFINDGQYVDPYAISGVSIFAASDNQYPSSVITSDGEIKYSASGDVLMHFSNPSALTTTSGFDVSNYNPESEAPSGIYKLSTGKYACVLSQASVLPNGIFNLSGENTITNRVSSTGDCQTNIQFQGFLPPLVSAWSSESGRLGCAGGIIPRWG